jgi:SAM-dependent methyltransferase
MTTNDTPDIDWVVDSRRFDAVAENYDAYRPGYPEALVETLLAMTGLQVGSRILEVGCGTGKATLPFARRGFSMLCIEPGSNLASVARRNLKDYPRVAFEVVAFEDWVEREHEFDLVISAQAFHWVPKATGYAKAAKALKKNAHLALFWNMPVDPAGEITLELERVYRERAPELVKGQRPIEDRIREREAEIASSGFFGDVITHRFPWSAQYDTPQYVGLLGTHSDHLRLSEEVRASLFEGVAQVIDRHGGAIEKPYLTVLHVARLAV